jgi:hypothetical protein
MRLIDADALQQYLFDKSFYSTIMVKAIENSPTVNPYEWISVEDRLPEIYDRVLINYTYEGGYNKTICAKYIGGKYGWVIEDDKEGMCKITHWMPLPEPPTEKEN